MWSSTRFTGGCSILEASIELLKSAHSDGKYDYFHLLTGEDLPIKPYAEFRAFLKENLYRNESAIYKKNYIGGSIEFDKKIWTWVAHYNVGVEHWRDKNPLYREFWKKTNHLLFHNSKLCTSVYRPPEGRSANLREIDFERGNGLGSPYTWQMEDYETLTHLKNYFAREFSKSLDEDIIVRILDYVKMWSEELWKQ